MSKNLRHALVAPSLLGILALSPAPAVGIDVGGMDKAVRPRDDFYA